MHISQKNKHAHTHTHTQYVDIFNLCSKAANHFLRSWNQREKPPSACDSHRAVSAQESVTSGSILHRVGLCLTSATNPGNGKICNPDYTIEVGIFQWIWLSRHSDLPTVLRPRKRLQQLQRKWIINTHQLGYMAMGQYIKFVGQITNNNTENNLINDGERCFDPKPYCFIVVSM